MTTTLSPEQQELLDLISDAEAQLAALRQEMAQVEQQIEEAASERQRYQLLENICTSLDELQQLGAAEMFWGEQTAPEQAEQNLERVRGLLSEFQERYGDVEERKASLAKDIDEQAWQIEYLNEDLIELREREERAQLDFTVYREERPLPYRKPLLPWTKHGEDENRFRKSLALVLLFVFALGALVNYWELPVIEQEVIEIPEHLVKVVQKRKPKPKPPEEKRPEKKEEEKRPDEKKPKPTKEQTKAARKKAESSGVLAFKDNFTDLLADDVDAKLGSSARLSNKGAQSSSDSSRSLVMSQARSSSGGISTAGLSRNVAGSGKNMGGVSFSRVESGIGVDMADDRPLSDGPGPSRTDEEIQIVFDRYKAALYRIYNRELRKSPGLKGKMVLRITIKPDGSVSAVKVESSDMNSPALSAKITERVKRFNFGAKAGVPTITILYPIDFLPAT